MAAAAPVGYVWTRYAPLGTASRPAADYETETSLQVSYPYSESVASLNTWQAVVERPSLTCVH